MSKFDSNPFDEEAAAPKSSGRGGGSFFDKGAGSSSNNSSSFDNVPISATDVLKRESELAAREAELKRREEEIAQRETALGIVRNNFPPFFPLIQHDISLDIPSHLQYIQYPAFWSWLGIMAALLFNFVAVLLSWILGAVSATSGLGNFFLAIIYVLLGYPLAYIMWYRRLYNALKQDSAIGFGIFFLGYLVHIGFCIFAAIAPPIFFSGYALTGVLSTISIFADGKVTVGIFYAIGSSLFIAESALSIYTIGLVYAYFRGEGKGNQLRREAALAGITGGNVNV
eukprot:TRINITY_DN35967_c0_g1_i1.p1 TRINITY_DN35967_c0_g1~~TRINITY_DN35967_c0_g1_i1.p1  ORF type:complete len:284 (-),score=36.47 TRINITY_DN35967_c0_g1_i1:274-1125(-)